MRMAGGAAAAITGSLHPLRHAAPRPAAFKSRSLNETEDSRTARELTDGQTGGQGNDRGIVSRNWREEGVRVFFFFFGELKVRAGQI